MRVFVVDGLSVNMFATEAQAKEFIASTGKQLPVVDHSDDLAFLTLPELHTLHTKIAEALGYKRLKGFKDKPSAMRRVFSVMNDLADAAVVEEPVQAEATEAGGKNKKKPKKVKPAKPGAKPAAMPNKGPKKRAEIYDDNSIIRLQVQGNPKREGTKAYDKYSVFRDGQTVTEALAEGNAKFPGFGKNWVRSELGWCIARNYVRLEPPTEKTQPAEAA